MSDLSSFHLSLNSSPHGPEPSRNANRQLVAMDEASNIMDIDDTNDRGFAELLHNDLFTQHGAPINANIPCTPTRRAATAAQLYEQQLRTPLPAVRVHAITSPEFELYNATLPVNINFQTRVRRSGGIRALYPNTAVDEVMRLYYPDYRCWEQILEEGIIGRMGVPSVDDIVVITFVVKRRGWNEEGNDGEKIEISPRKGDWDNTMAYLRSKGVGINVNSGLRGAHTVKMLIKLAN